MDLEMKEREKREGKIKHNIHLFILSVMLFIRLEFVYVSILIYTGFDLMYIFEKYARDLQSSKEPLHFNNNNNNRYFISLYTVSNRIERNLNIIYMDIYG